MRAAECLGASRAQVFRHVIVPGALPFIFTGLQISVGVAWFSLVAAEMVSGQYGLGYVINTSYSLVRYSDHHHRDDHLGRGRLRCTSALVRVVGDLADAVARARAGAAGAGMTAAPFIQGDSPARSTAWPDVTRVPGKEPAPVTEPAPTRGAIRIENVVKIYGGRSEAVTAVDGCSLDIAAGEIFMVVGPSGCGKTTLLNAVAGFHDISGGRILRWTARCCATARGRKPPEVRTGWWCSRTGPCSPGGPTSRT